MSTNFMSLDGKVKESKETTFTKVLRVSEVGGTAVTPKSYENVLHIGYDGCYGDVFKCWNDNINYFTLYFGTKADEFNK